MACVCINGDVSCVNAGESLVLLDGIAVRTHWIVFTDKFGWFGITILLCTWI